MRKKRIETVQSIIKDTFGTQRRFILKSGNLE